MVVEFLHKLNPIDTKNEPTLTLFISFIDRTQKIQHELMYTAQFTCELLVRLIIFRLEPLIDYDDLLTYNKLFNEHQNTIEPELLEVIKYANGRSKRYDLFREFRHQLF